MNQLIEIFIMLKCFNDKSNTLLNYLKVVVICVFIIFDQFMSGDEFFVDKNPIFIVHNTI